MVPAMELMENSIPFAEGAELIVDIPVDARGTGDVYIDDLIQATVVIDGTDNATRCERTTLLAIDTCARPSDPTSLYHKKIWRQGTNFRLRQDWKSK